MSDELLKEINDNLKEHRKESQERHDVYLGKFNKQNSRITSLETTNTMVKWGVSVFGVFGAIWVSALTYLKGGH